MSKGGHIVEGTDTREWPDGHTARITHGEWSGCLADVYKDDIGEGWHIEITGIPDSGDKSVAWDAWFENRTDVLQKLQDLGVQGQP